MTPLCRCWFARPPAVVARSLLGQIVVHEAAGGRRVGRIVETEAYDGPGDPGSHANNGPTPRSAIMWGPLGRAYVYFVYGNHHMLNVVAHRSGEAGAVLVRAVEPVDGAEAMARARRMDAARVELTNGPGKLCAALGVTVEAHNEHALDTPPLWVAPGRPVDDADVLVGPRVGLSADDGRPHRFAVAGSRYVSGPKRTLGPIGAGDRSGEWVVTGP